MCRSYVCRPPFHFTLTSCVTAARPEMRLPSSLPVSPLQVCAMRSTRAVSSNASAIDQA